MIGIWNKFLYIEGEKRNDKKSFEQRNRFSIKSLFLSVGGFFRFWVSRSSCQKKGIINIGLLGCMILLSFSASSIHCRLANEAKGKRKQQKPKSKSFVSSANRQSSFASCMSARHSKERRRENNRHPSESRRNFFGEGEMKFNVRKLEWNKSWLSFVVVGGFLRCLSSISFYSYFIQHLPSPSFSALDYAFPGGLFLLLLF